MSNFSPERFFRGIDKNFSEGKFFYACIKILGAVGSLIIFLGAIVFALANLGVIPNPQDKEELFTDTQTTYLNTGFTDYSYLDIDGRAHLVPLHYETLVEASKFGQAKGEDNHLYMGRVVVMALNPALRYVDVENSMSFGTAYDQRDVYAFYLPDGEDIKDPKAREHIIEVGNKNYKITLLYIDTRDKPDLPKYAYTFRIEEQR